MVELRAGFRQAGEAAAIEQVLAHSQVREQAPFLKHIADAAAVDRHEPAPCGVGQHLVVDGDAAVVGTDQPGDHVDDRGLAGAGAAEQGGKPGLRFELDGKAEPAEPVVDRDGERHVAPPRAARRAIASEANSATTEMTIATTVRRSAAISPPGTCVAM